MRVGDMAEVLGVGPNIVRRLIDRGEIPGWRIPSGNPQRRVDVRQFRAWLAEQPAMTRESLEPRLARVEARL